MMEKTEQLVFHSEHKKNSDANHRSRSFAETARIQISPGRLQEMFSMKEANQVGHKTHLFSLRIRNTFFWSRLIGRPFTP